MARVKNTPNDPERRERILAATMTLLQEEGISAVSARAVAARVGVPVGSVSYHFESVRSLLLEASRRIICLRADALDAWCATVTADTVVPRLAELIHGQLTNGRALTVVAYELYLLGLRDEEFREVSASSIDVLRDRLARHLPHPAATRLAAVADGFQLESLFGDEPPTVAEITTVLAH